MTKEQEKNWKQAAYKAGYVASMRGLGISQCPKSSPQLKKIRIDIEEKEALDTQYQHLWKAGYHDDSMGYPIPAI